MALLVEKRSVLLEKRNKKSLAEVLIVMFSHVVVSLSEVQLLSDVVGFWSVFLHGINGGESFIRSYSHQTLTFLTFYIFPLDLNLWKSSVGKSKVCCSFFPHKKFVGKNR
jgi:hypothetical protein